jgi:hypothetical protein
MCIVRFHIFYKEPIQDSMVVEALGAVTITSRCYFQEHAEKKKGSLLSMS